MDCRAPKTYIELESKTELGRFLSHLFSNSKRDSYCSKVLQFARSTRLDIEDFPKVDASYSRTIVARTEQGFEGMVARWDKGIAGVVHGHPDYAFYHLVSGRLGVEHFNLGSNGPELIAHGVMEPGDHFCVVGVAGRFDNAIHRITALEESLSVHMYSDDALRGCCYNDYPDRSLFLAKNKVTNNAE